MTEPDSSKLWADAMAAFDHWVALPLAERAGWLASLAARQRDVHARLLALIRADEEAIAQSFLGADHSPVAPAVGFEGRFWVPGRSNG
jgi:acyl-CoA reductase-like NAD-dependent aldehyde dehydrogenase